ncbi:MAG: hypothetical protein E7311_06475 [Clostridiales bacterium]|nr:hypothetical protein [Clostridiales bacterium]
MEKISNYPLFNNLRNEYTKFIYKQYNIIEEKDRVVLEYIYNLDEKIEFKNVITIWKKEFKYILDFNDELIKSIVFNIGIAEAISYYKTTCSKIFEIKCGYLDDYQKKWWEKLIYNGLGELRYLNSFEQVPIDEFITIISENTKEIEIDKSKYENIQFNGNLIPVGGGKDSIVTIELLKDYDNNPFEFYHKRKASYDTCKVAGFKNKDIFEVDRKLDDKLFELNKQGYINGHIPISSVMSFVSYLSALLIGKKYIVLSNESSSNEGNIEGTNINHQYSKSYEYEKDFNEYVEKYFINKVKYFSLLRPISEYQITKQLTKYEKYLNIFRSCNAGIKENMWCTNCPKCVFVYILLLPFLGVEKNREVFGKDILDDENIEIHFRKLIGLEYEKPFECVGTKEEIIFALKEYINKNEKLPILVEKYKEYIQNYIIDIDYNTLYNAENFIPDEYLEILKKEIY